MLVSLARVQIAKGDRQRANMTLRKVKGRVKGATDVIMTCNEISYAVNQGDKFILALVLVDGDKTEGPYYIRNIWQNELNFGVEHEAYKIADLMTKAEKPEETL